MAEELKELRQTIERLRWNQRILGALLVGVGIPLLVAAGVQAQGNKKLEVTDDQGRVRARVEVGKFILLNSAGEEKVRLTADENNGNLVLSGPVKKRLEVFMEPQTPRIVLYSPSGMPTLVLPP